MMTRIFAYSLGSILMFMVSGSMGRAYGDDTWSSGEVLLQLQELRRDINQLKTRISSLENESDELKRQISAAKRNTEDKSIDLNNGARRGDKKAKVAIVEFTDFQCPFCRKFYSATYKKLDSNYIQTGKLQYVLYDFPLSFHSHAELASIAANCADKQGQYWDMHDYLFENPGQLDERHYILQAKNLGLDLTKFRACLGDQDQKKKIANSIDYGSSLGVSGTPTFFVGLVKGDRLKDARIVEGMQSYSRISQIIDALLATAN